uniref:Uncharacterized protein n=1 Tax=Arundo donax TaxID=35708 RepID=A0A0A9DDW1_ARUDO
MPISCICCSTGTSPTSARNLLRSTNSTVPIVKSRRTCPTITKFLDDNASESIAVKQKASSKNVTLSTNHVGAYTSR